MRLHGEDQELIDAVVGLSVRYGIVTPYTSYLVTETDADVLTSAGRDRVAAEAYAQAVEEPEATSGGAAVDKAVEQAELAQAAAPLAVAGDAAEVVRLVGNRTFLFRDGIWTDTGFDASRMRAVPVDFASEDYFALINARPELAAPFALGSQVIALAADGTAYQVTGDGAPPLEPPATYTPAATAEPGSTAIAQAPATAVPLVPAVPLPGTVQPAPRGGLCASAWLAPAAVLLAMPLALRRRRK